MANPYEIPERHLFVNGEHGRCVLCDWDLMLPWHHVAPPHEPGWRDRLIPNRRSKP